MKYLLAAFFLLASTSHALSLKQQVPPIVILYPDGTYYTLAYTRMFMSLIHTCIV